MQAIKLSGIKKLQPIFILLLDVIQMIQTLLTAWSSLVVNDSHKIQRRILGNSWTEEQEEFIGKKHLFPPAGYKQEEGTISVSLNCSTTKMY